jgi:hypothetical protein
MAGPADGRAVHRRGHQLDIVMAPAILGGAGFTFDGLLT